jgi:hypothetical protein
MPSRRPHFYLPTTLQVAKMIVDTRGVIARSLALLQSLPAPDLFVGRKTQEPFPREEDLPPPSYEN